MCVWCAVWWCLLWLVMSVEDWGKCAGCCACLEFAHDVDSRLLVQCCIGVVHHLFNYF